MLNSLLQLDSQITQWFNELIPHSGFFNLFFQFFSLQASSLPIWFAIIILLVIFEEKINKKFIVYFFISLLITSIVVIGLKRTTKRPRPTITISSLKVCDTDFAFPSGHTTIAFASAAILASFDKKRKKFYYLIAGLIGFSRIYLQCHYFLDVFTGAIMGYIISRLSLQLNLRRH